MSAIQQLLMSTGGLPLFVSAGTPVRVNNLSDITLTAPGTIQNADKLVAILVSSNASQTMSSVPSGFALVKEDTSGNNSYFVYEKTASGESGNYAFSLSGSSNVTGVVLCYRNTRLFTAGSVTKTSSATATAPSITPTYTGALLQIFYIEASAAVSTPPSGTQRAVYSSNSPSLAVYEIFPQEAGATGSKTLIWDTSQQNGGNLIQLTSQ